MTGHEALDTAIAEIEAFYWRDSRALTQSGANRNRIVIECVEVLERLRDAEPPAAPAPWTAERHALLVLLDECRDAIQALTTVQVRLHNISPTLASRIDAVIEAANESNRLAALLREREGK